MKTVYTIEQLYINFDPMWDLQYAGSYETEDEEREVLELAQKIANEYCGGESRLRLWKNREVVEEKMFYNKNEEM